MHDLMFLAYETHSIVIQADGEQAVIAAPPLPLASAAVDPLERDPVSFATVRGRVETLSRRRGLRFNLYELTTDTAVTYYMDRDLEDINAMSAEGTASRCGSWCGSMR